MVTTLLPSLVVPVQSGREHEVIVKLVWPVAEPADELQADGTASLATWGEAAATASSPRAGCLAGDLKNSADGEDTPNPKLDELGCSKEGGRKLAIGNDATAEIEGVEVVIGDMGVGVVGAEAIVRGRGRETVDPSRDHGEGTWNGLAIRQIVLGPRGTEQLRRQSCMIAKQDMPNTFQAHLRMSLLEYAEHVDIQCHL